MSDSFDNLIQNPTGPEAEAAGGGAAPEKKRGLKRALLTIAAVLCVLALLVCGAAVWGYTVSVSDKNLPNVYVDGVFVGGMTREETAAALTAAGFDAMEDAQLSVSLPAGAGFTVDPSAPPAPTATTGTCSRTSGAPCSTACAPWTCSRVTGSWTTPTSAPAVKRAPRP